MKKMFRLTITTKIVGGFMAALLLLATFAWISIAQINKVDWSYSNLLDRRALVIENVLKLKTEVTAQENAVRALLITGNQKYIEDYRASQDIFYTALEQFAATAPNEAARKQITDLENAYDEYRVLFEAILTDYASSTDKAIAAIQAVAFSEAGEQFHELADGILAVANNVMAADQAEAGGTTAFITKMLIGATLLAILLGLAISLVISRLISKPVLMVSQTMRQLANGDFSVAELKVKNRDEIKDLVTSMNQMVRDLRSILSKVSESSEYIAASTEQLLASSEQSTAAAGQVAEISQKNATGAEQQLHSFEQAHTRIAEISDEVDQISESSEDMLKAALNAANNTQKGAELIQHVVKQMQDIHSSTEDTTQMIRSLEEHAQSISAITSLITGIAEQTNLLALNASIEAARAGEHGKGFAVVAEEVRKLAEESRRSADQVIEMVRLIQEGTDQAVGSMDRGNQLVTDGLFQSNQTKYAFTEIQSSMDHVSKRVNEVSASVEEIKQSSHQVAVQIDQVRQISEEGLQLSQESSAASEEQLATTEEMTTSVQNLASLAEEMQQQISRFKF